MERTVIPSRSPSVSPAHAPRIAAPTSSGSRPAGGAADQHVEGDVEDADQDPEDEGGVQAHAEAARTAGRAIRPPPSTSSPS